MELQYRVTLALNVNRQGSQRCPANRGFPVYVTSELFLSLHEKLKISLKTCTQEERFEVFPLIYVTHELFFHHA